MFAYAALILALQTTPAPSPSPTPAAAAPLPAPLPTDNPSVARLAREQFYAFASGKIDTSLYSTDIQSAPQAQAFLSALGAVKNVVLLQTAKMGESDVYVYKFTCENGAALEQLSLKGGKIDGIVFRPVT